MEKAAVAPQISLTAINFGLTFLTIGFSNSKFETRLLQFTEIARYDLGKDRSFGVDLGRLLTGDSDFRGALQNRNGVPSRG